jgi:acetyl esterase/lipase
MVEDVNTGIAWVARKIEHHGGDPEAVHLVGQSAGGQLALLALINQVRFVWGGGFPPGGRAAVTGSVLLSAREAGHNKE